MYAEGTYTYRLRCLVVFFIRKGERAIRTYLVRQHNGTFALVFYFEVDEKENTPIYIAEVLPKNQNEVWIFNKFARELDYDERRK